MAPFHMRKFIVILQLFSHRQSSIRPKAKTESGSLITDACDSAESRNVNEICILAPCDARHSLSYYIHYKLIGIPLDMFWLHDELCQTKSQLRSERRQFIIRSIIRSKNRVSGGFVLQQTGVHILLTLH